MLTTRCGLAFPFFTDFFYYDLLGVCTPHNKHSFLKTLLFRVKVTVPAKQYQQNTLRERNSMCLSEALWFLFWTLVHCASLLAPLSLISFIPMGPAKATVSIQYRIVHSTPFYSVHHSKKTSSLHGSNTSRLLGVVEVVGSEKNGKS